MFKIITIVGKSNEKTMQEILKALEEKEMDTASNTPEDSDKPKSTVESARTDISNKISENINPPIVKGYTINEKLEIGHIAIPTDECAMVNVYKFAHDNSLAIMDHGTMEALMNTHDIEKTTMLERAKIYRKFLARGAKLKEFLITLLPEEFKKYKNNVSFDLSRVALTIIPDIFDEFAHMAIRERGESLNNNLVLYLPELEIGEDSFKVAANYTIRNRMGLGSIRGLIGEKVSEDCYKMCIDHLNRDVCLTYGAEEYIINTLKRIVSSKHMNMNIYETTSGLRILFERVFESKGTGRIYGPNELREILLRWEK